MQGDQKKVGSISEAYLRKNLISSEKSVNWYLKDAEKIKLKKLGGRVYVFQAVGLKIHFFSRSYAHGYDLTEGFYKSNYLII